MDQNLAILERKFLSDPAKGSELLRAYQRAGLQNKYFNLRAELGCVAETAHLPLPSEEQTKAFVAYVATAHSWYKHLHPHEPTSFYFYLDPHVMMFVNRGGTFSGPIRGFDIAHKGDKGLFHYSNMPTEEYRNKFGYWAYNCRSEEEVCIYSEKSYKKLSVPEDLIKVGTVGLTSHVYGQRAITFAQFKEATSSSNKDEQKILEEHQHIRNKLHQEMYDACIKFVEILKEKRKSYATV